jgi:co-chaperonin GroES (HSP10)
VTTTASKVTIKPLEDRIVVQPLDAEQTTASGLVIRTPPRRSRRRARFSPSAPAASRTASASRSTWASATP